MAKPERFEIDDVPPDLAEFVHAQVGRGVHASDREVFLAGVRTLQQREAQIQALRTMVDTSIARDGRNNEDDVTRRLDATAEELRKAGY